MESTTIDVYKDWLGIPEGDRPPDHYALLRLVRFEDDPERIRANYKKLNAHVRKYATGQYAAESQELLNELAKAMLCLTDSERKREYDESLGREFEEEEAGQGRLPAEKVLVKEKALTREQVREAREFADARGLTFRDAVVQMKLVDAETATRAYAVELGFSYVDLADMLPDDSVLDKVPRNTVKRNSILPLFVDEDVLLVACVDEPTHELEEEMRLRFGVPMRAVMATPLAVNQAIARYYAPGARDESAAGEVSGGKSSGKRAGKGGSGAAAGRSWNQLSKEEQQQRKQLGILFICWGVILPVLFDVLVLKGFHLLPGWLDWPYMPSITTLIVAPLVALWVTLVYWK